MSVNFEQDVMVTGDLIESFFSMLAFRPSGTGGFDDFLITGPKDRESEIYQLVRERLKKSHSWVALTLTTEGKIRCSGMVP